MPNGKKRYILTIIHWIISNGQLFKDKNQWIMLFGSSIQQIIFGLMSMTPLVQSAQKGAYPEVMCATEENLKQKSYYGPTGRMNWTGPVGEWELKPFALDREIASKLWTVSEDKTGQKFEL